MNYLEKAYRRGLKARENSGVGIYLPPDVSCKSEAFLDEGKCQFPWKFGDLSPDQSQDVKKIAGEVK